MIKNGQKTEPKGGGKSTWRPPLDMSCRFGSTHGRQDVQLYTHAAKNDLRVSPQYAKGTQKTLQGDSTLRKNDKTAEKNSVLEQPGPSKLTWKGFQGRKNDIWSGLDLQNRALACTGAQFSH